jgi:hypothetical protein
MQFLLFIITLFVILREPVSKNRAVFINFGIFFFYSSLFSSLHYFVGKVFFAGEAYAGFYYFQFGLIGYLFFLSFAIVYLVIDVLFRDFKIYQKYVAAGAIILSLVAFYFHPFVADPKYLYGTEDIKQWKTLSQSVPASTTYITTEELASLVTLQSWKNGVPVGDLYPEENMKRIEFLLPYLEGDNYRILFYKPLYLSVIFMNVSMIFFMMLFFGYQYRKDPPQGAYIDKIVFVFLLFVSTEILHFWGYMKSLEWSNYLDIFSIGQYITSILLILMAVFFSLRLRFIVSPPGEFYETELASNPSRISRWRDWIDTIIIAKFLSLKPLQGRLFQQVNEK